MPSFSKIAVYAALMLSTASAAPTVQEAHIEARAAKFDDFGDHTGQTSTFNTDTDGTYIKSGDGHTYATGVKCWTDLFSVKGERVAVQWEKTDQEIDCGGSANPTCTHNQLVSHMSCIAHANGGTVEAGFDLNIGVSLLEFAEAKGGAKLGGSYVHTDTNTKCYTTSTTNTCGWADDKCHAVWVSTVSYRTHGFIRRRCDFHDGKGDQTVWSADKIVDNPTKIMRLGCEALCEATSYPAAIPAITQG